jgi:hypothetical protein
MERMTLSLFGALAVFSALNLQPSTAHAQGTAFTVLTIPNPAPEAGDEFGFAVAGVGSDRVLIGAHRDDGEATDAGAAYLLSTNGTLLTTFLNPTEKAGDRFGDAVAAVGTDRVLIGAPYDDTGATDAGAAYLFSTNGELLTTFNNPTPETNDWFGYCVAAVGTERVLIGAPHDNTGATGAGAAYLFSATVPRLNVRRTPTNTVAVSWTSPLTRWTLQQNTNCAASVNWSNAPGPIQEDGATQTFVIAPSTGKQFYRLIKP